MRLKVNVTKIYDKRDDFDFDIMDFPHLDGDIPKWPAFGAYTSQLIRYARAWIKVKDFKLDVDEIEFDKLDDFITKFIDPNTGNMKNMEMFQRRVLGLTSYFRSAQEKLLALFAKNGD